MKLQIKIVNPKIGTDYPLPSFATPGSAAMDLCSCDDSNIYLYGGQRRLIPTGIAVAIPEGYVGLIFPRSGMAVKRGVTLSNCVGVIDSDYRGEIKVGLINQGDKVQEIKRGDRIAQLAIVPVVQPELEVVDELNATERGEGGFGSTGYSNDAPKGAEG